MNLRFVTLLTLALATPLATSCTDDTVDDELAIDDALEGDDSKADGSGTHTFYFVEQDMRKCASPMCGGMFYRLANAETTRCIDGTRQARCYAANVDWQLAGLDESGMAKVGAGPGSLLLRARIRSRNWQGIGTFAELRPTEAWTGQLPYDEDGVVVKVTDTGVRCATFPCASLVERKLNSSLHATLGELGWFWSGATEEEIGRALDEMHTHGLIVSGYRYWVSGPGGTAKARWLTQFWLRATNDQCPIIDCAAPPPGCHYEGMVSTPCDQQTCGTLVCGGDPF
jgi:hypothetical protein